MFDWIIFTKHRQKCLGDIYFVSTLDGWYFPQSLWYLCQVRFSTHFEASFYIFTTDFFCNLFISLFHTIIILIMYHDHKIQTYKNLTCNSGYYKWPKNVFLKHFYYWNEFWSINFCVVYDLKLGINLISFHSQAVIAIIAKFSFPNGTIHRPS